MTLPTLHEILKRNFVDSDDTVWHTHVSLVQPRGKFQFNRAENESFWEVYCNSMDSETIPITGVAEKSHNYTPILVDIDLKIKDDPELTYDDHLYTTEHVSKMIEIYQSVLRNIVDSCDDSMLTCVLLEKPIYYITNGDTRYIKNGFHLHFPNLFLSKVDQNVHLFPRIKKEVAELNLFADIGIVDSATVVDDCSCTVPWLMYGSRKSEDSEPYIFSKVFNSDCKEISLEDALSDYSLYDNDEDLINVTGKVKHFLPRILSIVPYGRQMNELRDGLEYLSKEKLKKSRSTEIKHASVSAEESLKLSAILMPMLADFRADVYSEWMNIGWVLFNIGDGSSEALDQWLEFSQRSEKYDETKCMYEWERMVSKDKTIGTLKHFAKYDSPEAYDNWLKSQVEPLVKQSLSGSHNDIAKILYAYYGDEFRCASITGKTWFQFRKDQHRWEEIEEGIFLREHISNRLVKDYVEMAKQLSEEYGAATDKAHEAMIKTRKQQVDKLITNLKSAGFKNSIMTEAQEVFYDRTFAEKLDQNAYLIGFKNGVYDLKLNFFRPGTQDDYISKTIAIEYKEFIDSDNEVEDVKDFLQKIFPDSSVRTYFLDTYSDIFVGGNSQKKVYMWTGNGDNGKSIVQEIFERMMGQLAIKFNTQYFTGKKVGTGSANPELSRAAPPIRHVTMEEPDADEQLNIGELKKLSGGDSYWARDLFEKGKSTREVFPMFTLTFICNKLPKLKYSDKATWNRIRVIPFESVFVPPGEDCPETFEEQLRDKRFPMDRDFKHKIPSLVQVFAWYLLRWRQTITIRIEPEKVKEATAVYRKENDIYRQFVEEKIVDGVDTYLTLIEMYSEFKDWFKESFPHMSLPIKNQVKEYFEILWGPCERGFRWHGFRIRNLQDDLDSGDVVLLDEGDLVKYDNSGRVVPPI
jgi:P4 family phage/plasmid primase-like protien